MNPLHFLSPILTLFLALPLFAEPEQNVYLAAGNQVTVYAIDSSTGKLSVKQKVDLNAAGPMTASRDKKFLYVTASLPREGSSKPMPAMATFSVSAEGGLELIHSAPVNQRGGYLMTDATDSVIAGNHYGPGMVTIWKIEDGLYKGETLQEVTLEPKAHSAVFSPNNGWLLTPATGPNKVFQMKFDPESGTVRPNDPPSASGPQGDTEARQPRHLIFHPNLPIAYTTNERELPGVGVWSWNAETGQLETVQNLVTQPEGFAGNITTADLHLTPNARFLYVSNRDVTDRKATTGEDSIVAFKVSADTGRLSMIGHYPCEHVPRSFALDENGKFAYVAGQGDDRLGIYRINQDTGALIRVDQLETGARPSWVHVMSPPKS